MLIEFLNWCPHQLIVSNIALVSHINFVCLHEYQGNFRECKWRQKLPELSTISILKNLSLLFKEERAGGRGGVCTKKSSLVSQTKTSNINSPMYIHDLETALYCSQYVSTTISGQHRRQAHGFAPLTLKCVEQVLCGARWAVWQTLLPSESCILFAFPRWSCCLLTHMRPYWESICRIFVFDLFIKSHSRQDGTLW